MARKYKLHMIDPKNMSGPACGTSVYAQLTLDISEVTCKLCIRSRAMLNSSDFGSRGKP